MREIQMEKVIVYRRIDFRRGSLIEGPASHHTLKIASTPPYKSQNWTTEDLADLRDTISCFLRTLRRESTKRRTKKSQPHRIKR